MWSSSPSLLRFPFDPLAVRRSRILPDLASATHCRGHLDECSGYGARDRLPVHCLYTNSYMNIFMVQFFNKTNKHKNVY